MYSLRSRTALLIGSTGAAILAARVFLFMNPDAGGSTLFAVHVHHLLVGILLIGLGGIPAVLLRSSSVTLLAIPVFGGGLGLALDEWVLFVVREARPEAPYSSPVSLIGALSLLALFCSYGVLIYWLGSRRRGRATSDR